MTPDILDALCDAVRMAYADGDGYIGPRNLEWHLDRAGLTVLRTPTRAAAMVCGLERVS